jgi:protein dithiol oxidoreductase (disulfide-forming)
MKKTWLLLAAMCLTLSACGSREAGTQTTAATPAVEAAPAPTDESKTVEQTLEKAAATQEVASEAEDRGDATLERLAAMPENAQLPGGRWKVGVNYKPIVPAQTTSAEAGQVEVIEIFWLGCGHCYALEPFMQSWKKSKAEYIKFVPVPVMWGPAHRAHGRLYYTLEALGKGDLVSKAFEAIHKQGNMLVSNDDAQSQKMQLAFAKDNGVSEADFNREYNGFGVNTKLQRADELTRRYRVEGVPVVIVNGKYQTDVAMAGGQNELIQIINDLAASEKHR